MFPCQSLGWCHKVVPKYNSWWQTFVGSKTLVPHKCAYGSRPTPPPIRWKFCACACTLDTRRLTNTLKPRYNNNPPCLIWSASQIYRLTELGYLLWTSEKCTMMCSNLIFPLTFNPYKIVWGPTQFPMENCPPPPSLSVYRKGALTLVNKGLKNWIHRW